MALQLNVWRKKKNSLKKPLENQKYNKNPIDIIIRKNKYSCFERTTTLIKS